MCRFKLCGRTFSLGHTPQSRSRLPASENPCLTHICLFCLQKPQLPVSQIPNQGLPRTFEQGKCVRCHAQRVHLQGSRLRISVHRNRTCRKIGTIGVAASRMGMVVLASPLLHSFTQLQCARFVHNRYITLFALQLLPTLLIQYKYASFLYFGLLAVSTVYLGSKRQDIPYVRRLVLLT